MAQGAAKRGVAIGPTSRSIAAVSRIAAVDPACSASIDFDQAQAILASHAAPLGVERVPLAKAGRRVLAEPLFARIDGPRADTAAMDGYAVRRADLAAGQRRFRIGGASFAGAASDATLSTGEAIRIMTGATMPVGADTVVMLELVTLDGDTIVVRQISGKSNVRLRATDFAQGAQVLAAGRAIDPRALVVAASADVDSLAVWRRPRVGCIASGDELAAPGTAAASKAMIPDCLSEAVLLMSHQWGGKPVGGVRVADDPAAMKTAAGELLERCDVLVMIGGASRGDRDFARAALAPLGLRLAFADVAIKPGRPVWYGRIGDRHVLGLPGNPTAAMTIARLFLAPLLSALGGRGATAGLRSETMPLAKAVALGAREQFLCGCHEDGAVRVIDRQAASSQAMLARADLLVRLPPGSAVLAAGDSVATYRF